MLTKIQALVKGIEYTTGDKPRMYTIDFRKHLARIQREIAVAEDHPAMSDATLQELLWVIEWNPNEKRYMEEDAKEVVDAMTKARMSGNQLRTVANKLVSKYNTTRAA